MAVAIICLDSHWHHDDAEYATACVCASCTLFPLSSSTIFTLYSLSDSIGLHSNSAFFPTPTFACSLHPLILTSSKVPALSLGSSIHLVRDLFNERKRKQGMERREEEQESGIRGTHLIAEAEAEGRTEQEARVKQEQSKAKRGEGERRLNPRTNSLFLST